MDDINAFIVKSPTGDILEISTDDRIAISRVVVKENRTWPFLRTIGFTCDLYLLKRKYETNGIESRK